LATQSVFERPVLEVAKPTQLAVRPIAAPKKIHPVFWAFLLIYLGTWAGHYTSADAAQKIQWARQIIAGGPYWVDLTTGNAPKYGIGHSLISIPPLIAARLVNRFTGIHAEAPFYTLLFVLNSALLVYLVARYLRDRGYSTSNIWMTACAVGLATSWWPYSKLDASECVVATLFMTALVLLLENHPILAFTCASFMVLLRSDAAILLLLLVGWELWRNKFRVRWLTVAVGIGPTALFYCFVNYMRFGTILDHGYHGEPFSNPLLFGVYGILFSAGKSVFLFSPALLLGFLGWRRFRERLPQDAVLFAAVFTTQLLLYARWWDWSGDDSWGVRFMLPSVVLMTIPCVELLSRRRLLTAAALTAGLLVQLPALLLPPLEYVVFLHSAPFTRQSVYVDDEHTRSRLDFEDMRYNPRYSELSAGYALLELRLGIAPPPTSAEEQGRTGTPVVDILRSLPEPQGCRWDLIWCHLHSRPDQHIAARRQP